MLIQVGNRNTETKQFVLEAPSIINPMVIAASTNPTSAFRLKIEGKNFGSKSEYGQIRLGGTRCLVTKWRDQEIIADCTKKQGKLIIISREQSSMPRVFDYNQVVQPLRIISISTEDSSTQGGHRMTIEGVNFGNSGKLLMGNQECDVESYEDTKIVAITAPGEGTVSVRVDNGWRLSDGFEFNYDNPIVFHINPMNLPTIGGHTITIIGQNFGITAIVSVGGLPCPVVTQNHTHLQCVLPPGQGSRQPAIIRVANKFSLQFPYKYHSPSLLGMNPEIGPTRGGYLVTLRGTNFGGLARGLLGGDGQVSGLFGSVNFISHVILESETMLEIEDKKVMIPIEQVEFVMPQGGGSKVSVTVQSGDQVSNPILFQFSPPRVESTSPACVNTDGSQAISIIGTDFGSSEIAKTVMLVDGVREVQIESLKGHEEIQFRMSGRGLHKLQVKVVDQVSNETFVSFCGPKLTEVVPSFFGGAIFGGKIELMGVNLGGETKDFGIYVGNHECSSVVFDNKQPHSIVSCQLKPTDGSGFKVGKYPVYVRVLNQNSSALSDIKLDIECEFGE